MNHHTAHRVRTSRRLVVLGMLALLSAWAAVAHAGSDVRKGTEGAQELQLGVGGRGTALGSAITADAAGVEAMFWNPAGLASIERTEAMFSHTQFFADQKLNYAAVGTSLGGAGVLGFDVKVLSVGEVIETTEDAPEGTGQIFNPTFAVLGLGWAKQFTDRVLFGVTAHYVNESVGNVSASGMAFDFGVQYVTGWNGVKIGMAMKNFGPSMEFKGSDLETNILPPGSDPQGTTRTFSPSSAAFEMPSYFSLAATWDLLNRNQQRLALMGSFQNNNFEFDQLSGGMEWSYRSLYALRASYFGSFGAPTGPNGEEGSIEFDGGNDLYSGFALGGGASIRAGDTGRLGVDVSWRPVRDFFDDVVEFGVRYTF